MKPGKPLIHLVSLLLFASCTSSAAVSAVDVPATAESGFDELPKTASSNETVSTETVNVLSTRVIASGIEIEICYVTPDNAEWYPMPGHLFYDSYEVYPDEIEFLPHEKIADTASPGLRCALIRYRIEHPDRVTPPVRFSILNLHAVGREMYSPCEEFQQRLSTHATAYASGLQATCAEADTGTITVTLTHHASSVTVEQAQNLLDEIAKGEIEGPWEFTITEIER